MLQEIIVYIIGAAVTAYIVFKVYRMVTHRYDPCHECMGCELRSQFRKKHIECEKIASPGRQTNCGCNG